MDKEPYNPYPGVVLMRTCEFCGKGFKTDFRKPRANCCPKCDEVEQTKKEIKEHKELMAAVERQRIIQRML